MWRNDQSCYRITFGSTQQPCRSPDAILELTKDEMESINEWFATYGVEQNAKICGGNIKKFILSIKETERITFTKVVTSL